MPPKTGVCRLCNETRRFVNSHVIPAAFYDNLAPRTLEESEESATVRSFSTSGRAINIRLGVYGQFLCGACEVLFQQVDNYAVALFRDQQHPPDPATDHVFVGDDSIDIVTIRLFVLATLWRASVCEHPFFDKASLGPLESVYRDLLWTSLNGIGVIPEQVGAIEMQIHVVKFPDAPVLLPPSRYETPSTGQTFIRLFFGDFVAFALIAGPSLTATLAGAVLPASNEAENGPLRVYRQALEQSDFFAVLELAQARQQFMRR